MIVRTAILIGMVVTACVSGQEINPASGVPERVRDVLVAKCGACHGPDVAKPKGRFGDVHDLASVAKKYVKAGDAEESELWWYLNGEPDLMPPKKSKAGPLTLEEWALIRWWIDSGARSPEAGQAASPRDALERKSDDDDLGNPTVAAFHVVLVHFPIALAIAALLAELLVMTGREGFATTARFCLVLAFVSAFASAWSGWAAGDGYEGGTFAERVDVHRWIGVSALAALGLGTALIPAARSGGRARVLYRLALVLGAVLVGLTGHFGGELIHGVGHLFG